MLLLGHNAAAGADTVMLAYLVQVMVFAAMGAVILGPRKRRVVVEPP